MNERIRELIAKSTWVQFVEGVGHKEVFDKEQFAELIVRECIEQCNVNFVGTVGSHPSAHNRGVKKCIDNIKEHFGVSE